MRSARNEDLVTSVCSAYPDELIVGDLRRGQRRLLEAWAEASQCQNWCVEHPGGIPEKLVNTVVARRGRLPAFETILLSGNTHCLMPSRVAAGMRRLHISSFGNVSIF